MSLNNSCNFYIKRIAYNINSTHRDRDGDDGKRLVRRLKTKISGCAGEQQNYKFNIKKRK